MQIPFSLLWLLTGLIQADVPCSAEGVLSDVKSQVELACLGIAQNVQNLQTKNGVKDGYTQFWIDELVARAQTLRKNDPGQTAADIQTELLTWVHDNSSDIYNPFLTLDGECLSNKGSDTANVFIGLDPALDTPVEILHTILLGIVKYLWHGSHTPWTASQKKIYLVHLQSTE